MKKLPRILHDVLNVTLHQDVDVRLAKAIYRRSRDLYYNGGESQLTDAEYDALEDVIRELDPSWSLLRKTGHKVGAKSPKELRVPMPSLSKIKFEKTAALLKHVQRLTEKHEGFYVSAKIDGSSIEVVYKSGRIHSMATRGDGVTGKDISHFIPSVARTDWKPGQAGLPAELHTTASVVLRMEATIPKLVHAKKYANEYASDRAMASAVFNRHEVVPALRDLHFVLLGVVDPQYSSEQTDRFAAAYGFIRPMSVQSARVAPKPEDLLKAFKRFSKVSPYSLDGMVLGTLIGVETITEEMPTDTVSVKVDDYENAPTTVITDIVWQTSSFGVLVPKAVIKPIKFGNVTVKHAALHNFAWAKDRGAGIGATVRVLRSGEIIPKIVEVVTPAKLTYPDPKVVGTYHFDGVRLVLSEITRERAVKKIGRLFTALELEDVGGGFAERVYDAGFHSTEAVLGMTLEDVKSVRGVKTTAKKIYAQLSRAVSGEFSLAQLVVSSGVFKSGLGTTLVEKLCQDLPRVTRSPRDLQSIGYEGVAASIGPARASVFMEGLPMFIKWLKAVGVTSWTKVSAPVSGPLSGKFFSWTGYRSEHEEAFVKSHGGEVVAFSNKTTFLFYRDDGKSSSKVAKAGRRAVTFPSWKNAFSKEHNES